MRTTFPCAMRLLAQARATAFMLLVIVMANPSAAGPAASSGEAEVKRWHFKVLLDGKPIGDHEFVVTRRAQDVEVRTTAHFKVSAVFISLYHYDHDDQEKWSNGCLSQIDARTNENGKQLVVRGHASNGRFELGSPAAGANFSDCVRTFAYWDRAALSVPRLLNSGTGEYTPVELVHRGPEHINIANRESEAEHDSLQTNKFAIELWYSKAGEWLALQTQTERGRTLRYEAQ